MINLSHAQRRCRAHAVNVAASTASTTAATRARRQGSMATAVTQRLDAETIEHFRARLKGPLLQPDDPGYETARAVQNAMIQRRPALIAQCRGVADVIACVNFARERELLVAIRGGGHNAAGNGVCDDGLVIDLSGMRAVRVDPAARTARVEGGATWADLDRETQAFGLATPGGNISTTGVGGLTLHGGMGHLRRKYGFSVDNLLAVDVVTADGQLRTASATENADLFWAMRGAGSNFGVVTSLEFQLHPVGPLVALCAPVYPAADAPRVLAAWRDFAASAPDEVSSIGVLWSVPAVEEFPEELHGAPMVIPFAVYAGPADEGERLMQPLRELGTPLFDLSGLLPYAALQSANDPLLPKGAMYYFKARYVDQLSDDLIGELCEIATARPSPLSLIALWHQGGAISRVGVRETPLGRRDAPFLISFDGAWLDARDNERNIAWARNAWAAMQRHSSGGLYLNFAGLGEEKEDLVRAGYGENYDRLVQIKTKYDPSNLFRVNNNIKPSLQVP
jgi:FAD/FMN-containing dehydrogenase